MLIVVRKHLLKLLMEMLKWYTGLYIYNRVTGIPKSVLKTRENNTCLGNITPVTHGMGQRTFLKELYNC